MADPTTILGYATKRRDSAQAATTAAQQRLTTAQASIAAESSALAKATTAFTDLDRQAAEIRQKLSAIPTPADGDALIAALGEITIRLRTGQAAIVSAQARLLAAQADGDRAQADLANESAQLTKAEADIKQADQAATQRAARALLLAGPPLSTLATDATDALDETTLPEGANYRNAKARITTDTVTKVADIPAKLSQRAKDRRKNAIALVTQADEDTQAATDAVLKERDDNGGVTGATQKLWELFQRAEADVEYFVSTAKARFDQAQANLARVANLTNSPLTAEQTLRINDPALKTDRETAAATEKDRDDKLKAEVAAQLALDAEILKALAAGNKPADVLLVQTATTALTTATTEFKALDDPWRAEERDRDAKLGVVATRQVELTQAIQSGIAAAVVTATNNLKTAQDTLRTAENTYMLSEHGILHTWEAAVPDTMWRLVEDFEEAEGILNELKDADPAQLETDLQTAEANYVAAQLTADASASVLAQLAAEQARRAARQKIARQTGANSSFGALRGDN